ncbi:hypothetical protein KR084_000129 [Drosophila pseudotakahashii]|nr:hypothetical protein KR084_000129 [Drosophila pseudotakahashii]
MGRKGLKSRKKVKVHLKGHHPGKTKIKPVKKPHENHHKKHSINTHCHGHTDTHSRCHGHTHTYPRLRIPASKVFHKNCCKYKIRARPMRLNQCNLATQCPSRTIPLAAAVPLLGHPVRRNVVHLPETVVMDMRNTEDARRVAVSYRNTLIQTHVPDPDIEEVGSLEALRQIDLRPRIAYRRGRERSFPSDMDLCENFFQ